MQDRRIVITGLGLVTSLGLEVNGVFDALVNGRSGIHSIQRFDTEAYAVKFGGEITQWQCTNIDPREAKRLDRFGQFAMNAAIDAVKDSGLDFTQEDCWRCGAMIGSGIGGMEEFESGYRKMLDKGPDRVSPFMVPKLMCNAACGNVSIYYGLKGPNAAVTTACASGGHAIAAAFDAIRSNQADIMVAGGSEAALTPLGTACFIALKALSRRNDDPAAASRPWDKDRDGFVLSEGAGILVLEEYEHAKARGARIYAELLGYGSSADGSHITAPDPEGRGAAHAMNSALRCGGVNPDQVVYINAHGTSTELGDVAETCAVKRTFGDHAYKLIVSSTKSMTGHLLGASGGVEAVFTVKTIETGMVPPTINLDEPGEGCDLDYVPNTARQVDVPMAMSNSFGFGGHNVSLLLARV
jgi:3-oxoacyl-[acyl-carrier-protein] synthase II